MNDLRRKMIEKRKLNKIDEEITEIINNALANLKDNPFKFKSHYFMNCEKAGYIICFERPFCFNLNKLQSFVDELDPDNVIIVENEIKLCYKIDDILW